MTNKQPIRSGRCVQVLSTLLVCLFIGSAQAQINERSVAPLGLELMWENSIGGAGLVPIR